MTDETADSNEPATESAAEPAEPAAVPAEPTTAVATAEDRRPDVSDPAKLIRLGTMLQTLMNEVRDMPSDESGRQLLARIHAETMEELGSVLSDDLMDELAEFAACCDDEGIPSESEIRVAQAQLVGWLQGLLQGLQASMVAQQAAVVEQLKELQAARANAGRGGPRGPAAPPMPQQTGTYL